ncbi:hypothetical protein BT63DRAFT_59305 [Microthyrium microscopicum]|uniref:Uncharacterized protein n=1 Tax=Microthyrium microscopicum TaxID=703497 RepID=A0A6A6U2D6_9PEZI|nr:hypothetical protein BT63DRAFT_59305 [Microthyrium microscopicum]
MPPMGEVVYSQDATIAVIRDYYDFLTKLYLHVEEIIQPPEEGWPSITPESLKSLGKTENVVSLLQHLPYIREHDECGNKADGTPWTYFADWQHEAQMLAHDSTFAERPIIVFELSPPIDVPSHVISLTIGGRNRWRFLLDTELGVIYWIGCPEELKHDSRHKKVKNEAKELDWRAGAGIWAITEFFDLLKDQYIKLNFWPYDSQYVYDIWGHHKDGVASLVRDIYSDHEWPDLTQYRKEECLEALGAALEEHFPLQYGLRDEGDPLNHWGMNSV